ncbi:MAG: hypothetical protein WD208_07295 [Dehalococcoidia bacterium]
MSQQTHPDYAPARVLFPEYWSLDAMVRAEIEGLTDEQLDWESGQWGWSEWSIRRQVSHMGSLVYRWMLERWGDQVFPYGSGITDEQYRKFSSADFDRRMDEREYWDIADIVAALTDAVKLARRVLEMETVGSLRVRLIPHRVSPQWPLMVQAHPRGVDLGGDGRPATITLEATFRHMYFEYITHLYNIQRLKRAQGLPAIVRLPREGYWTVPGWDVSEP